MKLHAGGVTGEVPHLGANDRLGARGETVEEVFGVAEAPALDGPIAHIVPMKVVGNRGAGGGDDRTSGAEDGGVGRDGGGGGEQESSSVHGFHSNGLARDCEQNRDAGVAATSRTATQASQLHQVAG